jgi:hypothetical protein
MMPAPITMGNDMTATRDEPLPSTHLDADALPWEFLADASKVSFGSMAALASPPTLHR